MPSIKKSVMISDATFSYIDARTKHESEITWSQAINEGFKALKWLTDEALPDLDVLQCFRDKRNSPGEVLGH